MIILNAPSRGLHVFTRLPRNDSHAPPRRTESFDLLFPPASLIPDATTGLSSTGVLTPLRSRQVATSRDGGTAG
jgi:hypothetical protein